MEVAHRDRIRVAVGPLPGLRGGPHPDPGQGTQPSVGHLGPQLERLLQPARVPARGDHRLGPRGLDPGPVPFPGRDLGPGLRRRRDGQAGRCRTRRRIAVRADQRAPGRTGLPAGGLLLEDAGHERLDDEVGPRDAPARIACHRVGDHRMRGNEVAGRIVLTTQAWNPVQHPAGSGSPRLSRDGTRSTRKGETQRDRPLRRAHRSPDPVGGVDVVGRVPRAAAQRGEGAVQVQRPGRLPLTNHAEHVPESAPRNGAP